ncbi:MAG TPA: HAMP domain-containing sensor histidine kinase [Chitinophagaceae bacterium]|nr:HAMP domain-containing sensor histidine kinase [Chitinophagaceae bacterium]
MRLLQRTIRSYLIYSALVILVAIPVFYFIISRLFLQDVDEALLHRRKELVARLNATGNDSTWDYLQSLDGNIQISPLAGPVREEQRFHFMHRHNRREHGNEPFRVLSSVVHLHGRPYRMIIRQSLIDSEDLSQGIVLTQTILLVILLTGLLLINRSQSRKIWLPFYITVQKLREFELDKHAGINLAHTHIREFNDLNQAISQLVKRNQQVYLSQKEFTENAAHEMQTPLAIFRTKLDLLLQHSNLDEQQAEQIQSLTDTVDRLTRLNRCLLLLSKIENRQFMDNQPIHLAAVLEKTVNLLEEQYAAKNIRLIMQLDKTAEVMANAELMDILISNLLSNAIRHNIESGEITIRLEEKRLMISNTGPALVFEPAGIFDRFRKNPASPGSTGLGLAIVKEICEASGFTIQYAFKGNRHNLELSFGEVLRSPES